MPLMYPAPNNVTTDSNEDSTYILKPDSSLAHQIIFVQ